jgi:hypothetical protein
MAKLPDRTARGRRALGHGRRATKRPPSASGEGEKRMSATAWDDGAADAMRPPPPGIEDGIDQLSRCRLPRPPAGPRIRDHGRDQLPLGVGQIGAVAPPRLALPLGHSRRLASLIRRPMGDAKAVFETPFKRALSRASRGSFGAPVRL